MLLHVPDGIFVIGVSEKSEYVASVLAPLKMSDKVVINDVTIIKYKSFIVSIKLIAIEILDRCTTSNIKENEVLLCEIQKGIKILKEDLRMWIVDIVNFIASFLYNTSKTISILDWSCAKVQLI